MLKVLLEGASERSFLGILGLLRGSFNINISFHLENNIKLDLFKIITKYLSVISTQCLKNKIIN